MEIKKITPKPPLGPFFTLEQAKLPPLIRLHHHILSQEKLFKNMTKNSLVQSLILYLSLPDKVSGLTLIFIL